MNTIKKKCVICNNDFPAVVAEINRGRGFTCSKECRYKRHSQLMSGHKMKPEAKKKLIKALTGRIRSKSHSRNISNALKGKYVGENNVNWRGGTYQSQGRWYVRVNNHPHKHQNGYILRSRYNVEQTIGRLLTPNEHIHHINFQKNDDRPENLYIFPSAAEHSRYHNLLRAGKTEPITESNLSSF